VNIRATITEDAMKDIRFAALVAPLVAFVFSCTQVAAWMPARGGFMEEDMEFAGWCLVVVGPFFIFHPLVYCSWLANPLFLMSIYWFHKDRRTEALVASVLATVSSFVPLAMLDIESTLRWQSPIALVSRNGNLELRIGYLLWVGSHLLMLLATACQWCLPCEAAPARCPDRGIELRD
jgi:hypothetical protein